MKSMDGMKEIDKEVFIFNTMDARLGSGTFGSVYRGVFRPSGSGGEADQQIAIKIFNNKAQRDKEIEADLMEPLNHPNIVKVVKTGYSSYYGFYIAMELCDTTLKGFLSNQGIKKFSEPEACVFFRDICRGIKYLQEQGIVHRDLKLENIMIDFSLRIKICDFGLAKFTEDNLTNTTCGSTHIMAPEILKRLPYGKESDIWSLGVLLYGMLTGEECLFRNVGRSEYESRVKNFVGVVFPSNCDLSFEVKNLISSILVVDPRARPTIDQILSHPWVIVEEDDELMSSRVVLEGYIEGGEAMKRAGRQLAKEWDRRIAKEMVERSVEALGRLNRVYNEVSGVVGLGFANSEIEWLYGRIGELLDRVLYKKVEGSDIKISMERVFDQKKAGLAVDFRETVWKKSGAKKEKNGKDSDSEFFQELILRMKNFLRMAEERIENIERIDAECKFMKIAVALGLFNQLDIKMNRTIREEALCSFCNKHQIDVEHMRSYINNLMEEYTVTEMSENDIHCGDSVSQEVGDLVDIWFGFNSNLSDRLEKILIELDSKLENRIDQLKH